VKRSVSRKHSWRNVIHFISCDRNGRMMEAREKKWKRDDAELITQFYSSLTTITTLTTMWRLVNSKWFYMCMSNIFTLWFFFFPVWKWQKVSTACTQCQHTTIRQCVSPFLTKISLSLSVGGDNHGVNFGMDEVVHVVILMFISGGRDTLRTLLDDSVSPPDWPLRWFLLLLIEPASVWIYVSYIRINDNDNCNRYVIKNR